MTVDYELAKTEKKAQLDAGSVTAAGPVGAGKKPYNNKGKFGIGISSKTKCETWERNCLLICSVCLEKNRPVACIGFKKKTKQCMLGLL